MDAVAVIVSADPPVLDMFGSSTYSEAMISMVRYLVMAQFYQLNFQALVFLEPMIKLLVVLLARTFKISQYQPTGDAKKSLNWDAVVDITDMLLSQSK